MPIDPRININENQVIFRRDRTGHNHDGLTSALIDTTKYSMFDFVAYPTAPVGTPRRGFQENNLIAFKSQVVAAMEERVLNPRGIRIQANAITAREIVSGTITADELAANIVLVNNIIQSNGYITGNTGWAIDGDGTAEFSNVTVRGTVVANSGSVGNITISNSSLSASFNTTHGFSIYSNGFADFNDVSVRGHIEALTGYIDDDFEIGNNVTIGSNLQIGGFANIGANASIGTSANIGTNAYIGQNLYVDNYLRINSPQPSNVTVVKISGISNTSNTTYSLVVESPNGNNIFEIRDDRRVTITGNAVVTGSLVLNGSSVTTGGPYLPLSGGTLTGFVAGTALDMSGNIRLGGQLYTDNADNYLLLGRRSISGIPCVKINQDSTLYNRPGTGGRAVLVNSNDVIYADGASSARYKEDIFDANIDSKNVLKLRVVTFKYKKEFLGNEPQFTEYGLIAEEVAETGLDYLVSYDADGQPDSVLYHKIPLFLLKSLQDQQKKIDDLEARLQAIEGV